MVGELGEGPGGRIVWKDLPLAQKLAKEAGGAIIHHGPKKPLASPLAAPAPKPKSPTKPNEPAVDILDRLPDNFDIDSAAWVGDLAVLLPTEPTARHEDAPPARVERKDARAREGPPRRD